jgi:1-deoxy-D-xylulose-5-phosphate reductoisomerase
MGEKITIDSATLMNKGLEVIEAHHLFGLPYDRIDVVIHPQSLVHALVRLVDGALLAHLGVADMRVPIAYALNYPARVPVAVERLNLAAGVSLDFTAPDEESFPAIRVARAAGLRGDAAACALNAANEVAVRAFLEGGLPFLGICEVVKMVAEASNGGGFGTYDEVVAVDLWARQAAKNRCAEYAHEHECRWLV